MKCSVLRLLESRLLAIVLAGATVMLGAGWVRANAARVAPPVVGYDWSLHPRALLVVVPPDGCGCGPKPLAIARDALKAGQDVVIVTAASAKQASTPEMREVREAHLPASRVAVFSVDAALVKRFAPAKEIATVEVKEGRILDESRGSASYQLLDRLKREGEPDAGQS